MAAIKGTSMTLQIGGTALGMERTSSINLTVSDIDTTNKGTSHQVTRLAGNKDWSVDFEALFDDTDTVQDSLDTAYLNRSDLAVAIVVGNHTYSGTGLLSDLSIEGAHDDAVVISGSINAKAALAKTTSS